MNDYATESTAVSPADDRGDGLAMFLIFTGAALIVTGAVAVLALVDSWWMLGIAFAVHVAMTAVVALTIVGALNDRLYAIREWAGGTPPPDGRLAGNRQAHGGPAAAR